MNELEPIIGLEIHVQLNTETKLFCDCKNGEDEVNTLICSICTSQPGTKPKPMNSYAIKLAYNAAYLLNAKMKETFYVLRKHYFYPDLPSGYQRTTTPISVDGFLDDVEIKEIHIEEDPGRYDLKKGLVDYNRAGVPLIEIVTKPVIKSDEHAKTFLKKLERGLTYYGIIKENGTLKADANISLKGHERVEIKNINSFENVATALRYEIKRQKEIIESGGKVERETRHFDESSGKTIRLRKKEREEDYRYIPDPDLMPITIDLSFVNEFEENPFKRFERLKKEISEEAAFVITEEKELANFYEYLAKFFDKTDLSNWIKGILKKQLNYRHLTFRKANIEKDEIKVLLEYFFSGKISDDAMEKLLIDYLDKKQLISKNIDKYITINEEELAKIIKKLVNENEEIKKAINDYKKGEQKALSFIIGKLMKITNGKADPKKAKEMLEKIIQ